MDINEEDPDKECNTQHNGFHAVCLPSFLQTGYHVYRQHEELPETKGCKVFLTNGSQILYVLLKF